VAYENLMPGSRLINRLQDLGYRVQVLSDAANLAAQAEALKPLLVMVDLISTYTDVCAAIAEMKKNPNTTHIPILAYTSSKETKLQKLARESGASMVASDDAIFDQFPQMLDQLLAVE
jgi:PleD family two-component response regulator